MLRVRGGLVLDLRRSYRSGWEYRGAMGSKWDFLVNRRLRQLENSNVVVTWGNCRSDEFTWDAKTKAWKPPPSLFSTLVQGSDGTWTQTFSDGRRDVFDFHGNHISRSDRYGNKITLHYSAQRMPISARSPLFVDIETACSRASFGSSASLTRPGAR